MRRLFPMIGELASILVLFLLLSASPVNGREIESNVPARLDKLLKAVKGNDHESFIEDGTTEFRAGLSSQMLEGVSVQLSSRMKNGYETEYFGSMSQQGHQVYLWKIVYEDGGDDTLAKLVLKERKTAGFLLQ